MKKLDWANRTIGYLRQNPEQKFTAREIANWIFKTYPDDCNKKLEDSKFDSKDALLQQIAVETSNRRVRMQEIDSGIKTTEGRPRRFYFTESSDSDEINQAESNKQTPTSLELSMNMNFIQYYPSFYGLNLRFIASVLTKNALRTPVAQALINGSIPIWSAWKTSARNGIVRLRIAYSCTRIKKPSYGLLRSKLRSTAPT